MMVENGLVGLGILILLLILFLLFCKIWQHLTKTSQTDNRVDDDVTESIIPEELSVGQTIRCPLLAREHPLLAREHTDRDAGVLREDQLDSSIICSTLILEVISGPSSGVRVSQQSTNVSGFSLRIGRVPENDLAVNDPEVSGKHALVNWNSKDSKWELVDMGSLNGTRLNSQPVSVSDSSLRRKSSPVQLSNGDVITLGSTSKIVVQIVDGDVPKISSVSIPFGVGFASDPMTMRKGGRKLPMEDVCHCEWPLRGIPQFGVFCIFDGHGGAAAAEAASKIMPQKLADILLVAEKREEVLYNCDAADVLRNAFRETEAALDYQYEGCTATVLLLWSDLKEALFAQCANVGDSACIFSIEGKHISMTEDHRLTSLSEKSRMLEIGKQLRDGETRLCGMNIARVLGDKFLKEQDVRFSAEPYISEVLQIKIKSKALAMMASDGLWDVLSPRRALQLALEVREGQHSDEESDVPCAQRVANLILREARTLRTKDNTTVIVLDFASMNESCKVMDYKFETISRHN